MKRGKYIRTEEQNKRSSKIHKGLQAGKNNPMYGKHHSEETRRKQSEARKGKYSGKNHPLYGKTGNLAPMYGMLGDKSPMFGKHHSDVSRSKMSKSRQGKTFTDDHKNKIRESVSGKRNGMYGRRGCESPNWKGGITEERLSRKLLKWSKDVRKRDRKCFTCRTVEELQAHHIQGFAEFPEKRFDVDNGITLCKSCHIGENSFHNVYGWKDNNTEQLLDFQVIKDLECKLALITL